MSESTATPQVDDSVAVDLATAIPIIPSRLQLPPIRAGLINRPAVLARLDAAAESPLISIVAPAGYGKTTVLTQWLAHQRRPFATLAVDDAMDDPGVFVTYLAHALDSCVELDPAVGGALRSLTEVARARALAGLAASVARCPRPFVLALDDGHRLNDRESVGVLRLLLENLPAGSQIVMASRWEPALPLARLRASGSLVELGTADLRLDVDEVQKVMARNEVTVRPKLAAHIAERSEGWPVAAYIAALIGKAGGDLHTFGGADRAIVDYLSTEVLDGQPPELRDFLIRSSALDEFNGALCDEVLQVHGSAEILAQLERSNLLVVPLDRRRQWFRYHHLLRETLRTQSELQREPDSIRRVQRRASAWFERDGQIEVAVRYAQRADDEQGVRDLLLAHAMPLFAMGRADTLRRWFDWLWDSPCHDERAAVMCAWLRALHGDGGGAQWCLDVAAAGDVHATMFDSSPVAAWIRGLQGLLAHDSAAMLHESEEALELLPPISLLRPTAQTVAGMAHYVGGDLQRADSLFESACESSRPLGTTGALISSLGGRGAVALDLGRWDDAAGFAADAERLIESASMTDYAGSALVHAVAARVASHRGDRAAGLAGVAATDELLPYLTAALRPLAIMTRVVLARALLDLNDVPGAGRHCEEAETLIAASSGFVHAGASLRSIQAMLAEARSGAPGAKLSPAELRLAPLLETQLTFGEIADRLFVSVHTVKAQVTSIYRKLDVTSRTSAVERMRRMGILEGRGAPGSGHSDRSV